MRWMEEEVRLRLDPERERAVCFEMTAVAPTFSVSLCNQGFVITLVIHKLAHPFLMVVLPCCQLCYVLATHTDSKLKTKGKTYLGTLGMADLRVGHFTQFSSVTC